ncbi:rhomboid family intramembrane serine protease [Flavobacteriaceae bacterium S356]|uniref:Rhomboid family intramembrane serine protease n=1 Tax=Asprobacillus argus TaxID=3076534 RepID=A0ABU3LDB2_9FLAO|nr:rhomboid family intramembrane serine protease [Flavobacteriaceae bacterium S356]
MIESQDKVVLLVIAATALFSYKGFNDYSFFEKYKFQITRIQNGEKFRMFTSGLLHADWMHLLFNMYALYLFGDIVVFRLGIIPFLVIYLGSLLAGSLYSLSYHKHEPYYSAIGASGAVSGIVYASILLYPEMELFLFFVPIPIKGYIFGVIYLLYSIYGMKKQLGNIGHSAHLGGAIGGFALTLVFYPRVFQENTMMVVALTIPILILLFFGKKLNV